jgi:branched-chain amino acid aminotransferase
LRDVESGAVSEVFCMGTAAVVAPIGRIGFRDRDYEIAGAQSASVARRLYQGLTDIQYGRVSDPYGWALPLDVSEPAAVA